MVVRTYPITNVVFSFEDYGNIRATVYEHNIHALFSSAERKQILKILDAAKDQISDVLESALARIEQEAKHQK